jgi:hypothetical protein
LFISILKSYVLNYILFVMPGGGGIELKTKLSFILFNFILDPCFRLDYFFQYWLIRVFHLNALSIIDSLILKPHFPFSFFCVGSF